MSVSLFRGICTQVLAPFEVRGTGSPGGRITGGHGLSDEGAGIRNPGPAQEQNCYLIPEPSLQPPQK